MTTNEKKTMAGKSVLVVDDEPDVLDTVAELLDMCDVTAADNYDTALKYLLNNTFDIVVLDIMGVNGFELLEKSVLRGFQTVMLTSHAVTPDALKKSIKLGAAAFIPKEYMKDLEEILGNVLEGRGTQLWWRKNLDKGSGYLEKEFGQGWKEKDAFFKEFESSLKKNK
jgi:DNA-binding NtrC family response regulator